MSGGPPGGLEAPGEDHGGHRSGQSGAAPAGGQLAGGGGSGGTQPPAEPPATGEQPEHEDGQEYWFLEDDGDEADWQDAADDEDLDAEDDEELEAWDDEFGNEEDFSDDDDDLNDWDEDDGSESSDAPEAEEAARDQLEADTAGRFLCPGWAAYPIPTASHHFQSADALALSEAPGPGGSLLAATFDLHGVTVWLLPPAGDVAALGPGQLAFRLGGFQAPREAFSLAFSPDGRWLATGAEGGLLTLYSVEPTAPPRPQLPPGRLPPLQGLNYFYTPLLLPQQLRLRQQQEAQAPAAGDGAVPGDPQAAAPPPAQACEQPAGLAPGLELQVMDLAIDAVQRKLQVAAGDGGSPRQCQLRHAALHEELEQNRAYLRAVMGQDMYMLLPAPPPPAAGGHPVEPPAAGVGDLAAMEHEVAASYRSFMYRAGAAVQLLQAIGRQREAAEPDAASGAAAEAVAGAVLEAAAAPAEGAASTQPQQADQQDKAAGKRPLTAGQAADAAAQQQHRPAQQGGQQAQQQEASSAAAVQLRGILAVGMQPEQARRFPFLGEGMLNGVRFGMVAGKQRLLAADQSGYVYVFELPSSAATEEAGSSSSSSSGGGSASSELRAEQLLCAGLGEPSRHWRMRPVNFFSATQHPLGARVQQQQPATVPRPGNREGTSAAVRAAEAAAACPNVAAAGTAAAGDGSGLFLTAALGPFPMPCNLAAASPDGRWIAAVGDAQAVYLADQSAGFAWRSLPFDLAGGLSEAEQGLDAGSQYCAWNASSSLLAASSDSLHAIFVWEPRSGQLLMRVEGHGKPCLSLGFAPWNERLLVYAEDNRRIHLREVPAVDLTAGEGSSGAGGAAGAANGALCGPALCEQHARDDLADARAGVQLLQLPIVPSTPSPSGHLGAVEAMQAQRQILSRRRRVTGLSLSGQGDLLVTTRQGTLLRYLSSQTWRPEKHRLWPPAFRAAVATLLLCGQRQQRLAGQQPGQQAAGLWLLPLPVLQLIIAAAAGQRNDWLPKPAADTGSVAAPQAGAAAQGGVPVISGQEGQS